MPLTPEERLKLRELNKNWYEQYESQQVQRQRPSMAGVLAEAPVQIGIGAIETTARAIRDILPGEQDPTVTTPLEALFIQAPSEARQRYAERYAQPGTSTKTIAEAVGSLGYSAASAGAALGVGALTSGAGPLSYVAAGIPSFLIGYGATRDQKLEELYAVENEEYQRIMGYPMSRERWERIVKEKEYDKIARDYALWEAIPETAGQLAGWAMWRGALSPTRYIMGKVGKPLAVGKAVATAIGGAEAQIEEQATETLTGWKQSQIDSKLYGTPALNVYESFKQQAPVTALVTLGMTGGGSVAGRGFDIIQKRRIDAIPTDKFDADNVIRQVRGAIIATKGDPRIADRIRNRYSGRPEVRDSIDEIIENYRTLKQADTNEGVVQSVRRTYEDNIEMGEAHKTATIETARQSDMTSNNLNNLINRLEKVKTETYEQKAERERLETERQAEAERTKVELEIKDAEDLRRKLEMNQITAEDINEAVEKKTISTDTAVNIWKDYENNINNLRTFLTDMDVDIMERDIKGEVKKDEIGNSIEIDLRSNKNRRELLNQVIENIERNVFLNKYTTDDINYIADRAENLPLIDKSTIIKFRDNINEIIRNKHEEMNNYLGKHKPLISKTKDAVIGMRNIMTAWNSGKFTKDDVEYILEGIIRENRATKTKPANPALAIALRNEIDKGTFDEPPVSTGPQVTPSVPPTPSVPFAPAATQVAPPIGTVETIPETAETVAETTPITETMPAEQLKEKIAKKKVIPTIPITTPLTETARFFDTTGKELTRSELETTKQTMIDNYRNGLTFAGEETPMKVPKGTRTTNANKWAKMTVEEFIDDNPQLKLRYEKIIPEVSPVEIAKITPEVPTEIAPTEIAPMEEEVAKKTGIVTPIEEKFTETQLTSEQIEKLDKIIEQAKLTPNAMIGVTVGNSIGKDAVTIEEKRYLANKGLHLSDGRYNKLIANYPQELRIKELREKVETKIRKQTEEIPVEAPTVDTAKLDNLIEQAKTLKNGKIVGKTSLNDIEKEYITNQNMDITKYPRNRLLIKPSEVVKEEIAKKIIPTEVIKEKQPWEMTRIEYTGIKPKSPFTEEANKYQARWQQHGWAVEQALKEGKTISPEVLADYPDLVKQTKAITPVEEEITTPLVTIETEKLSTPENIIAGEVKVESVPVEPAEVETVGLVEYKPIKETITEDTDNINLILSEISDIDTTTPDAQQTAYQEVLKEYGEILPDTISTNVKEKTGADIEFQFQHPALHGFIDAIDTKTKTDWLNNYRDKDKETERTGIYNAITHNNVETVSFNKFAEVVNNDFLRTYTEYSQAISEGNINITPEIVNAFNKYADIQTRNIEKGIFESDSVEERGIKWDWLHTFARTNPQNTDVKMEKFIAMQGGYPRTKFILAGGMNYAESRDELINFLETTRKNSPVQYRKVFADAINKIRTQNNLRSAIDIIQKTNKFGNVINRINEIITAFPSQTTSGITTVAETPLTHTQSLAMRKDMEERMGLPIQPNESPLEYLDRMNKTLPSRKSTITKVQRRSKYYDEEYMEFLTPTDIPIRTDIDITLKKGFDRLKTILVDTFAVGKSYLWKVYKNDPIPIDLNFVQAWENMPGVTSKKVSDTLNWLGATGIDTWFTRHFGSRESENKNSFINRVLNAKLTLDEIDLLIKAEGAKERWSWIQEKYKDKKLTTEQRRYVELLGSGVPLTLEDARKQNALIKENLEKRGMELDEKNLRRAGYVKEYKGELLNAENIIRHSTPEMRGFTEEYRNVIIRPILDMLVKSQRMSQDTANFLREKMPNYVPYKGWEWDMDASFTEIDILDNMINNKDIGPGFSALKPDFRRAEGRLTLAHSSIVQGMNDHAKAVMSSENNKAMIELAKFVKENPAQLSDGTYLWRISGSMSNIKEERDRTVGFRINGKPIYIVFADKQFSDSIKKVGVWRGFGMTREINGFLRGVTTSFNIAFTLPNFARDIVTAGIHLQGLEETKQYATKIMKETPKYIKQFYAYERHPEKMDQETRKLIDLFISSGGQMGIVSSTRIQDIEREIKVTEKQFSRNPNKFKTPVHLVKKVMYLVEDMNTAVENGVRFSTFVNLINNKDNKVDVNKAANIARKLTINFNQHGQVGPLLNSLYLFANAGLIGPARIFEAAGLGKYIYAIEDARQNGTSVAEAIANAHKNDLTRGEKRVQKIMAGLMLASFTSAIVNMMIDDDDYEQFSDYTKDNYFMQMLPGGKSLAWKLPYGYNIFNVIGTVAAETIWRNLPAGDGILRIAKAAQDSFNPIGGGTLTQVAAPTFADLFVQLDENKNFFGGPIRPGHPPYGGKVPESQLYFSGVSKPLKVFTEWLNRVTGGEPPTMRGEKMVHPGISSKVPLGDISPEYLDHIVEFITGGIGKTFMRSLNLGGGLLHMGDMPSINNIPFMRDFYREADDWTAQTRVYDMIGNSERYVFSDSQIERFIRAVDYSVQQGVIPKGNAIKLLTTFKQNQLKTKRLYVNNKYNK